MKKIFFCACLVMAASVWATQPENVVRAIDQQGGGYILMDENNNMIGFSHKGSVRENMESIRTFAAMSNREVEIVEDAPLQLTMAVDNDSVGPLLGEIAFNQGAPYNYYCPRDNQNKLSVTGCVATAMAQIMKYHNWPKQCLPYYRTYTTSKVPGELSINFDTVSFDWDKIKPAYQVVEETTTEEKLAVAYLMKACGYSVKMNYSSESSGTQSTAVPGALQQIFNYKSVIDGASGQLQMEYMSDFTISNFQNVLIAEIQAGRPIYSSGQCAAQYIERGWDGGHAYVIDGYCYAKEDTKKRYPFFHFNWGWGGMTQDGQNDIWYRLQGDQLCPYLTKLDIIRGIMPNDATPLDEIEADGTVNDNRIYDMMGRVINEPVAGQIYIRNGKKFIAQ